MNNEQRIRQYLNRKAETLEIAPATSPATSGRPQPGRSRVAAFAAAAALVLVGAPLAFLSLTADDDAAPTESTIVEVTTTTIDPTVPTTTVPVLVGDGLVFDSRSPDDVFALVELDAGGVGFGYSSSLLPATPLPDAALAAAPDGRGGVVYVSQDQVFWIERGSDVPVLLEDPGISVHLVGLRHVGGSPAVYVLIGDKLIGYDGQARATGYAFDEFSDTLLDLDVDGQYAVGLITADGNHSVELVSMLTGEMTELISPVPGDEVGTPTSVTISDDRIAIQRLGLPITLLSPDGTEIGSVDLGIEDLTIHEVDLAGDSLLVAFGEAATVTDIVTGDRVTVSTPLGWVVGSSWAPTSITTAPPPEVTASRYRVDTEKVLADRNDPYLNVRMGVGTENDLIAKLPPTYTGLQATGQQQEAADDGAIWFEVILLDPISVDLGEPLHGGMPIGWVNSRFLKPLPEGLPVTVEELPACSSQASSGEAGAGSRTPTHLYALESAYLTSNCLRVVVTFGAGEMPFSREDVASDVGPADALPVVQETMSGSSGARFDLGGIAGAWFGATETDDGIYIVTDGDKIDLLASVGIGQLQVHEFPSRGQVVIDIATQPLPQSIPAQGSTIVTQILGPNNGTVTLSGIARPFEAHLGVSVRDESGNLVEALYSGSLIFGTERRSEYAVQTPGWSEAWAPFSVKISELPPGDYTVVLDGQGGADEPVTLDIPITMPPYEAEPAPVQLLTEAQQEIVQNLVWFAQGQRERVDVPFADEVIIGLGSETLRLVERQVIADPVAWRWEIELFAGYSGPFDILDVVARSQSVELTAGPINHCASPPVEWPSEWSGLRQLNVQPVGIDSCLQWFGISIFIDNSDQIAAVVLDLYEP